MLAQSVARAVAEAVKNGPPKEHRVYRTDANGATYNEVKSLPQLMAELCDQMKVASAREQQRAKGDELLAGAIKKLAKIIQDRGL